MRFTVSTALILLIDPGRTNIAISTGGVPGQIKVDKIQWSKITSAGGEAPTISGRGVLSSKRIISENQQPQRIRFIPAKSNRVGPV